MLGPGDHTDVRGEIREFPGTHRDRAAVEELIARQRDRTLTTIADLTRVVDDIVESNAIAPPDDEHDPEGATVAFERAQATALLSAAQDRLVDLDQATQRLRNGTYGTCERCRNPIVIDRLLARPTAVMCVGCQSSRPS